MKLFTKADNTKLFANYSKGSNMANQNVVVKIFNPYGKGRWYIMNSDPNDPDYLWGIVDLGYGPEVGSISRSDLENYRNRFGWGFERDLSFRPKNANVVLDGLKEGNFFDGGGSVEKPLTRFRVGESFKYKNNGTIIYKVIRTYNDGGCEAKDEEGDTFTFEEDELNQFVKAEKNFDGGGEVEFIDYGDSEIMYEPHSKKYYANDMEFDTLKEAKKFIDSGEVPYFIKDAYSKGLFAGGGATKNSKLFTKEDDKILFKQHQFGKDLKKQDAIVEIYQNYGNIHYYIVNADPKDPDTLLAIIKDDINDEVEVDFVSRKLLENKVEHGIGGTTERLFDTTPFNADRLYWYLATGKFYVNGGAFMDGVYAGGGKIEDEDIKKLNAYWESYYKGINAGKKDKGYTSIKNTGDLNNYIISILGNVVKKIELIEKGKNYPYNFSNPYYEDIYSVELKNGTTFRIVRSYGKPRWEGNVDYKEQIIVQNIKQYAGGGSISNFDPMSLIGKTFYSLQSHGKIINVRILSDDNIKIKYEVSNTFSVEKSFSKKELFDMAKGKEVDGNSILKSTMAYGGKTTFAEKSSAIAKNFVGKAVEPKYQKEYGKRYDAKEAKEVGNKIAGKQKATYDQKNMKVGGTTKRGDKFRLITQKAKEIRKDGEKWQDAIKRASAMLK